MNASVVSAPAYAAHSSPAAGRPRSSYTAAGQPPSSTGSADGPQAAYAAVPGDLMPRSLDSSGVSGASGKPRRPSRALVVSGGGLSSTDAEKLRRGQRVRSILCLQHQMPAAWPHEACPLNWVIKPGAVVHACVSVDPAVVVVDVSVQCSRAHSTAISDVHGKSKCCSCVLLFGWVDSTARLVTMLRQVGFHMRQGLSWAMPHSRSSCVLILHPD